MEEKYFTPEEKKEMLALSRQLLAHTREIQERDDFKRIRHIISDGIKQNHYRRDRYGINPTIHNLNTAMLLCDKISPDRNMIIAILLFNLCKTEFIPTEELVKEWGDDIAKLIRGLLKVSTLYSKQAAVESDNFRKLLLTFAEDIRVIIIMIVDRLALMRTINHHPNEKMVHDVAYESNYLYAPLAHRLGLYAIKSELEDLSLKYTNRKTYTDIAHKLNETKVKRDQYIAEFIKPIREKLDATGLKYEIKGRTKSIYSIWNKLKKQKNDIDHIYDLFAIRIIIDTTTEKEKSDCWLAYSVITDMYQPNPSRMKDWLSIPKSNGYESLHITVYGPGDRWVEVQIRTKRMDLIAEKGLAAHWKYKGIKSEGDLDTWMNNVRDILEAAETGPMELMKNMKMDIYDKEVFVFTPKGDLYKLPLGASLLDFAFHIHSKLGMTCTGGKVNGKNQKLNYKLKSGDTVEILTSTAQAPKLDWLAFVVTSKARNKIRQTVHEMNNRSATLGKELLERRFKNRKIELNESSLMKVIKKLGYKTVTDFYDAIADESLDINNVITEYEGLDKKIPDAAEIRSAEEFQLMTAADDDSTSSDVLVIGDDIKGINYRLSKCCNPIYGDDVFGFISAEGVIKIHRHDCPNATNIREKYPYRLITTRWSGKLGQQFGATLRIVGNDDLGIVTSITSIINKERDTSLRSISIDSNDGIFQGFLVVGVNDTVALNNLIKKLKTVKGVKDVQRSK
ncbi:MULTISPECIES: bifunctional (p)ppGpp synthetase/guanosine-3',5'-bis(diphosphate) 3'-pyrophosphohydrolase [Muribaculum]|jgi:relA/spoT family protein|uniref:Bifunctional (P)ppGpp synthetase/guanosine-3',5'-bis(Diphosphate) 3'-pyrophosphohydrolase n=28 Tax=Muribaculum TaxID=1918540 RepID=A0A4P7VKL4_9BACT|nr:MULTISPECIES: RelA/SpoT family protein [Muribaculum]ROT12631.1 bifunctional (p)ppGpp synthetase/guanosine-3',5'-bis(diphosphate) 3'-pyrophosphohydrolase [Muribaculaceae bacterium Isolate-102 (HZI)]THG40309.1 bifunctional (p)ppGpp synthetase/guanosine-3',5'-bis(diphosphate) 3'-pyrophosphohydrolase [Muribaculaceae bacterium]MCX4277151.1 RelA/SpoT family protein [Muribaculum sp.]QCD35736.1 bifunctional (p)ppGpp synthetase/guanosine-3',5'-bis(diphosphate) 3'-pyrophosphohydrolase [Muribaculum gor